MPPYDVSRSRWHLVTYMRWWAVSSLVHVWLATCRLSGDEPLPEPVMTLCQLDTWEHISVKLSYLWFDKYVWKYRLQKWANSSRPQPVYFPIAIASHSENTVRHTHAQLIRFWDDAFLFVDRKTSYQATLEGVSRVKFVSKWKNLQFWQILQIYNFDFVLSCLGIQYDSIVWVIMRWRWVSSERRRSSCCSYNLWRTTGHLQIYDLIKS